MITAIMILAALVGGYFVGLSRINAIAPDGPYALRAQPRFHAAFVAFCTAAPMVALAIIWALYGPGLINADVIATLPADMQAYEQGQLLLYLEDARTMAAGGEVLREHTDELAQIAVTMGDVTASWTMKYLIAAIAVGIAGLLTSRKVLHAQFAARVAIERIIYAFLIMCALIAVLTTFGIVMSLIFETFRFFEKVSVTEFLFGLQWSPQTAIREDQVGSSGAFGAIPLFAGTMLITVIAMFVAAPVGLLSAIFLSEFSTNRIRGMVKPLLEILAGIPTVVYGFFAALTVAPLMREAGMTLGLDVAAHSALAAGVVMGMMIIPLVSSLSDDVMNAVPQTLRDGAYALGATQAETIRQVVLPAALPGIVSAMLLAISRAIGETMIVVMAAGLAANLTANPLQMVTTVTVQIVTLLVGDQEFDSAKTLAAFALGLLLFIITLALNVIALRVVQKYREQYD